LQWDEGELRFTLTTSIPCSATAIAAALEGFLVTARSWKHSLVTGSASTALMREPPWLPVAPKHTSIFFGAMAEEILRWKIKNEDIKAKFILF
jgi:hypothetical protein